MIACSVFLSLFSISSPSLLLALPLPSAVREMCVGSIVIGIDVPLSETCKSHLKSAWWWTVGKRVGCLLFCALSLTTSPPPPTYVCCSLLFPLSHLFSHFSLSFFSPSLLPAFCHLNRSSISGGTSPLRHPISLALSLSITHTPHLLLSPLFFFHFLFFFIWARIHSKWFQVSGPQTSSNRPAYTYTQCLKGSWSPFLVSTPF